MRALLAIATLCVLVSPAFGSTFELSDPADQFFQEPEEEPAEMPSTEALPADPLICTVDLETADCQCTQKEDGARSDVGPDECAARVRRALGVYEAG